MGSLSAEAGTSFGDYVIERKLGAGGMAEVFLARRSGPRGFQKRVAIKRILPELSEDSRLITMFCDEARVAATLSHPNIVQIVEFGEQSGELYIVMEYVDGVSCSTLLRNAAQQKKPAPVAAALYIVREVLLALAFAHEAVDEEGRALGIVHRDVSPSNVLVSRVGNVKLIDFGITRSFLAERRTYPGEMKGKLRYMSPEQILAADVDARSDLFAVGVVLAELLTSKALFHGKNDLEILGRISRGEKGIIHDGEIPEDLVTILDRALAHRPLDRYATAREFARAIDDAAAERGLRLDDTVIVPFMHELGVLPSSSGTRQSAVVVETSEHAGPVAGPPPLPVTVRPAKGPREVRVGPPASRRSGTYRVKTKSGQLIGPLGRGDMLALIATGRLTARSHVALAADSFVAAGTVPALSGLASHPAYRFREDDETSPQWLRRIEGAAVPQALYRLAREKRTGLLAAVDGKRRKRVFFVAGDPVFVASTNRDELLGRRLVHAGTVTEGEVELALGRQPPLHLGEALVSFGALGAAQLVRELSSQVEDRVVELGQWRAGELRFFPDVSLPEALRLKTRETSFSLVLRLVREGFPAGDIATFLRPFTKDVLTRVTPSPGGITAAELGLPEREGHALDELSTGMVVRDAVTRATQRGVSMAEALLAVFVGLTSGLLTLPGFPDAPPAD